MRQNESIDREKLKYRYLTDIVSNLPDFLLFVDVAFVP